MWNHFVHKHFKFVNVQRPLNEIMIIIIIITVQLNLDYQDSLGPDEIVRIIENMNINGSKTQQN